MKKIIAQNSTAVGFILNGVISSLLPSLVCQVVASFIELVPNEEKTSTLLVDIYNRFAELSGQSVKVKMKNVFNIQNDDELEPALNLYSHLSANTPKEALPGMVKMIQELKNAGFATFTTTANGPEIAQSQTYQIPGLEIALSHIFSSENGEKPHLPRVFREYEQCVVVFDATSEHTAAALQFVTIRNKTLRQIGFVASLTLDDLTQTFRDVFKAYVDINKTDELDESSSCLNWESLVSRDNFESAKLNAFSLKQPLTGERLPMEVTFDYCGEQSIEKLMALIKG
jgi:hypothetical protein